MRYYFVLLLLWALEVVAQANLEKRRDKTCTKYTTANRSISQCRTASTFCSGYLTRGATTATVYTTTRTTTKTSPTATVTRTSVAATSTTTVYVSTKLVTRKVGTATTKTVTLSATASGSTTITTVATITPAASTVFATVTTTSEYLTTERDPPCTVFTNPPAFVSTAGFERRRKAKRTPQPAFCGVGALPSAQVSGACSCYLDVTSSLATTTTATVPGPSTTVTVPSTTTATVYDTSTTYTTITSTSTSSTTGATTTVATVYSTATSFSSTTTLVANTVTGTTTTTSTRTVTELSAIPTCEPDDTNSYGPPGKADVFRSSCNKTVGGYIREFRTANDMYECMAQCSGVNSQVAPWACLGVDFYYPDCKYNCQLYSYTAAADSPPPDKDYPASVNDGARVLSPALDTWGNTCRDGETQYGTEIYDAGGNMPFASLCGMTVAGNNIGCSNTESQNACLQMCVENRDCFGVTISNDESNYCCLKSSLDKSTFKVSSGSSQTDLFINQRPDFAR